MARILCIDYGGKRTGIAVTDPFKMIATALCTIETPKLIAFLTTYFSKEAVELVIIGMPLNWDETATHATPLVERFITDFKKAFPDLPIQTVDERYTSKMATDAMLLMGLKKKQRQEKGRVDQIAAAMMLQEFLNKV